MLTCSMSWWSRSGMSHRESLDDRWYCLCHACANTACKSPHASAQFCCPPMASHRSFLWLMQPTHASYTACYGNIIDVGSSLEQIRALSWKPKWKGGGGGVRGAYNTTDCVRRQVHATRTSQKPSQSSACGHRGQFTDHARAEHEASCIFT